jgi:hypothetical protein
MGSYTTGSLVRSILNSTNVEEKKYIAITDIKSKLELLSNTLLAQSSNWDFASNASVYTYLSLEAYINGYTKMLGGNNMLVAPAPQPQSSTN